MTMDCTKCASKGCKISLPCVDRSDEYLEKYLSEDIQNYTKTASELIDNGRAGSLSRLQEIVEYSRLQGYSTIGVAYCYGMEKEAVLLRKYLRHAGLHPVMVSCTVDGIKESQIDPDKMDTTVSCNPLGQANVLNSSGVKFTILMGLCLGHDILLQKNLKMDFSTLIVKDRVYNHNPLQGIPGVKGAEDDFIENMPQNFNLVSVDELKSKLANQNSLKGVYLLDLRGRKAFETDGIKGSLNCLLSDLPKQYKSLMPDKTNEIIVYCNGGIQSIYAVMLLTMKGYTKVKSLSGGFSRFMNS
ncbi:MAG: DUF1847 domain-containing protein [Peptostreptococcaceae bacterium]|nr:DUF1847 domain-containing protein [Peptostreptococcaceae bacterium]